MTLAGHANSSTTRLTKRAHLFSGERVELVYIMAHCWIVIYGPPESGEFIEPRNLQANFFIQ